MNEEIDLELDQKLDNFFEALDDLMMEFGKAGGSWQEKAKILRGAAEERDRLVNLEEVAAWISSEETED